MKNSNKIHGFCIAHRNKKNGLDYQNQLKKAFTERRTMKSSDDKADTQR